MHYKDRFYLLYFIDTYDALLPIKTLEDSDLVPCSCFHLSTVVTFRSSPVVLVIAGASLERRKDARSPQRKYSSTALGGSSTEQTPSSVTMLACFSLDVTAVCRRNDSL